MENSEVKYTPMQLEAINDRGNNLLVSASAGSGKTTVMIERIISLMMGEPKVPITDFLVVTFTKASASDMKRKLIEKLYKLQADEWVISQIENVQTSDISNLHSFCSRLISVYFYKAQVDPAYHIIDEVEANLLKEKAASKLFEEKEKFGDISYFKLFEIFQKKRSSEGLKQEIFKLNNFLNSILDGENWFRNKINETHNTSLQNNVCAKVINNYVCGQIKKDIEILEKFAEKARLAGCEKYALHFEEISQMLCAVNINKSYLTNSKNIFDIELARTPIVKDEFKYLSEEAKFVKEKIKRHLENYKNNYVSADENELVCGLEFGKEMLECLLELVLEFNEIYSKLKKDANGLDFNDLEKSALLVLSDPAILSDVKARYKYVFVDEYQDINEVQEKIIDLISGKNNRFMVGDIKQSIYRFRYCDPDIFLGTYQRYRASLNNDKVINLNANFRSDKKILKFVDMVFCGVMTNEFGGLDYEKDSMFVAGENNLDLPNSVNLCFIDTESDKTEKQFANSVYSVKNHEQEDDEDKKSAIAEANYVAGKITELISYDNPNRINLSDIAILVQSRNESTAKFLQTLASFGIAVSSDEKNDIAKNNYIDEILSFVKLCVCGNDDILLFKVLKSNLFQFSDNELATLRRLDLKLRFYEVTKLFENLSDQNLKQKMHNFYEKLFKFKELSKVLSVKNLAEKIIEEFCLKQINLSFENGAERLSVLQNFVNRLPEVYAYEFVFENENFSEEMQNESGEDAVKFMSIHASKGIEFKAVFLVNISKQFSNQSLRGDLLLSKQFGAGINYFDFDSREKHRSLPLSSISLTEQRKLVEENQRVLYVGLTRAKQKLFVVCSKQKSELLSEFPDRPNSFSCWFEKIISDELSGKHIDFINFETIEQSKLLNSGKATKPQLLLWSNEKNIPQEFVYKFESSTKVPLKCSVSKIISSNSLGGPDEDFDDEYEAFETFLGDEKLKSFAERGTAYHKVFEALDFKNKEEFDKQFQTIKSEILSQAEASYVDKQTIENILKLPFFKEISANDIIIKEREFCANINSGIFDGMLGEGDNVLLQGVIDLIIVRNNELILLDYKTGNQTDEKLKKYKMQLELYASAASRAFDMRVVRKYICFIDNQKIIEI